MRARVIGENRIVDVIDENRSHSWVADLVTNQHMKAVERAQPNFGDQKIGRLGLEYVARSLSRLNQNHVVTSVAQHVREVWTASAEGD